MQPQSHPIIELVAARTRHLRLLAAELIESRQALVRLDLDAIYRYSAQQQALCEQIQRLDARVARYASVSTTGTGERALCLDVVASGWDEEAREHLRSLLGEHDAVRKEVQEISRVQTDLLRRSRRYLRILSNLVSNSMGFYEAPSFQAASTGVSRGI